MAAADPSTERLTASCKCGYTVEEDFLVINPHVPRPSHLRTPAEQAEYERSRADQPWQPRRRRAFKTLVMRLILLEFLVLGWNFVGVRQGYFTVYEAAGAVMFSVLVAAVFALLVVLNR